MLELDVSKFIDFVNGNISYVPYVPAKTTLNVPSSHLLAVVNGYTTEYALESNKMIISFFTYFVIKSRREG